VHHYTPLKWRVLSKNLSYLKLISIQINQKYMMHQDLLDSWLNMDTVFASMKSALEDMACSPITSKSFVYKVDVGDDKAVAAFLEPSHTLSLSSALEASISTKGFDCSDEILDVPLVDFEYSKVGSINWFPNDAKLSNFSADLSNINLSDFSFESDVINTVTDSTLMSLLSCDSVCLSNFWLSDIADDYIENALIQSSKLISSEDFLQSEDQIELATSDEMMVHVDLNDTTNGSFSDVLSSQDADSFVTEYVEADRLDDHQISLDSFYTNETDYSLHDHSHDGISTEISGDCLYYNEVIAIEEEDDYFGEFMTWPIPVNDSRHKTKTKRIPRRLTGKLEVEPAKKDTSLCKRSTVISKDERAQRKKECDREAAYRYRQRKKKEVIGFESQLFTLDKTHRKLRENHSALMMEATFLIKTIKAVFCTQDDAKGRIR